VAGRNAEFCSGRLDADPADEPLLQDADGAFHIPRHPVGSGGRSVFREKRLAGALPGRTGQDAVPRADQGGPEISVVDRFQQVFADPESEGGPRVLEFGVA
jgi:hypothetical protein